MKKQISIRELSNTCLEKWGKDSKTEHLSTKIGKFVAQLNDDFETGNLLLELLKHYNYYSKSKIDEILIDIYSIINNDLKLVSGKTIYSRIEDDSKIDSSNWFLEEFKVLNDISNYYSHDISKVKLEDFDYIDNVIFFDDVVGSGKTVERFFNENKEKLLKTNNYIFCIEILDDGFSYLSEYFKVNNIRCEIIPQNIQKKAFAKGYIFEQDNIENEALMEIHEKKLWGKSEKFILGFENSQALISFFRNTPNNTISSFWFSNERWIGLFPRNDQKPVFLKRRKPHQNRQLDNHLKYNLKVKANTNE